MKAVFILQAESTLIPELDRLFSASLHVKTVFADKPLESTAKGLGVIMDHASEL